MAPSRPERRPCRLDTPHSAFYNDLAARNLTASLAFLTALGLGGPATASFSPQETLAVAALNKKEFIGAYRALLCPESRQCPQRPLFCSCCPATTAFLRNHALLLHIRQADLIRYKRSFLIYNTGEARPSDITAPNTDTPALDAPIAVSISPGAAHDGFTDYLIAAFTRDANLARTAAEALPFYWDAYLLLATLTETPVDVRGPFAQLFRMTLKIRRGLHFPIKTAASTARDTPAPSDAYVLSETTPADNAALPAHLSDIDTRDGPTLAAYLAVSGEATAAAQAFAELIFQAPQPRGALLARLLGTAPLRAPLGSLRYAELYIQHLYNHDKALLTHLAATLALEHPHAPVTHCATAAVRTLKGDTPAALRSLRRALSGAPRQMLSDVCQMLGHVLVKNKRPEEAVALFVAALRGQQSNLRLLYAAIEGFFSAGEHEYVILFGRAFLARHSDGRIWKLLGRAYLNKGDVARGQRCMERAESHGEADALLYMADSLRSAGRIEEAVALYERYMATGVLNRAEVARFLTEFYDVAGDADKASEYRSFVEAQSTAV